MYMKPLVSSEVEKRFRGICDGLLDFARSERVNESVPN
jgi:hypothetical protein